MWEGADALSAHVGPRAPAPLADTASPPKVFLQKTAVNLLDSVLDTPEYFWSQPDSLQLLYEKVGEYVELEPRIEVINQRFQLLHEMLELIRDVGNTNHSSRLEWIIIWLIVIEVIIGIGTIVSSLAFHGWGW